ncbi:MAG: aspartyl protease family protein [Dehalococcoidia bacterium]
MISGEFADSRPFVFASVIIPTVGRNGTIRYAGTEVAFLIDTGADVTILKPSDYETLLDLRLAEAATADQGSGLGGSVSMRRASGFLYFNHDDGRWSALQVDYHIPEPLLGQEPPPFALLGRDVWGRGRLIVDLPAEHITLDLPTFGQ